MIFLLLLTLCTTCCTAELPLLPIQNIEADHIDFQNNIVYLTGHVQVYHDFGVLQCDKSTIYLNKEKQEKGIETILLNGTVCIHYTDGSCLHCDEGIINCPELKGTFTAVPPQKVLYTGFTYDGEQKIPIKASGKILKATIVKTEQGYTLSSLQGEGNVSIEYLRSEKQKKE